MVELYTEQSQFVFEPIGGGFGAPPCVGEFALGAGTSLDFQTNGTLEYHNRCKLVTADLTATNGAGIEVIGPSSNVVATFQARLDDAFLHGAENVRIGGCSGAIGFAVVPSRAPGAPFSTPVPGQLPPAVLYRLFLSEDTSNPACPASCEDNFVVHLEELRP